MTLIVAAIIGTRIEMLADSQIDDPNATNKETVPGRLKIISITPDLVIAYAGRAAMALDEIREIASDIEATRSFDTVSQRLLAAHEKCQRQIDFLLGCSRPQLRLCRVAEGQLFEGAHCYCIGNPDTIAAFGAVYAATPPTPAESAELAERGRFGRAFEALLRERPVGDIGGIPFHACGTPHGFVYVSAAMVWYPEQTFSGTELQDLRLGTAADGAFAFCILVPEVAGPAVVGIYALQGNVGFLYRPLVDDTPAIFANVTYEDFRQRVREQYDVALRGIRFENTPTGPQIYLEA